MACMNGREFGVIVCFHGDEADSISLAMSDPAFDSTCAARSDDGERKRDAAHKRWLVETIGRGREFSWGGIWVGRDPKTTDAGITIQYKRRT